MMSKEQSVGHIIQVVGVVVDVEFKDQKLPGMYDALQIIHHKKTITS